MILPLIARQGTHPDSNIYCKMIVIGHGCLQLIPKIKHSWHSASHQNKVSYNTCRNVYSGHSDSWYLVLQTFHCELLCSIVGAPRDALYAIPQMEHSKPQMFALF